MGKTVDNEVGDDIMKIIVKTADKIAEVVAKITLKVFEVLLQGAHHETCDGSED